MYPVQYIHNIAKSKLLISMYNICMIHTLINYNNNNNSAPPCEGCQDSFIGFLYVYIIKVLAFRNC